MIDKRLFKIVGARRVFIHVGALTFFQAIFIIIQVTSLAYAITLGWRGGSMSHVTIPAIGFFVAYLLRHLVGLWKQSILDDFSSQATEELRIKLMDTIYEHGPKLIQKSGIGGLVTTAEEGTQEVETYFNLIIGKFANVIILIPMVWATALWLNSRSALVLVLVAPVVVFFMIILGLAARAKASEQYKGFQQLANYFTDALRGLPTLHLLGLSKKYASNIFNASEVYRKKTLSVLSVAILSTFALDFFTTLSIAMVALFLGISLINGSLDLFPALAILILVPEFFLPLRDFASDYHATLNGKNAFGKIFDLVTMPKTPEDPNFSYDHWNDKSHLSIKGLSAHYDDNEVIKDLTFDVKSYQKIGIIGVSGSGKSTIIDIIGGFMYPDDRPGQLSVNGQSLSHLKQAAWQNDIIYIPQKPYIFRATIADNIAFYNPSATDQDIAKAAEYAGLTDFIHSLPNGSMTMIGDGEREVSGGQAQRIALARAFLSSNRRILLFDEPTAHLDIETELELKQTMLPLFDKHLVFFATHRLHWVDSMDYVIVLDDGKIIAQGTPRDLRQKAGPHTSLFKHLGGAK